MNQSNILLKDKRSTSTTEGEESEFYNGKGWMINYLSLENPIMTEQQHGTSSLKDFM